MVDRKTKSEHLRKALRQLADPVVARSSRHFFKAEKGGYGEGDRFLGIRVPVLREQVRKNRNMDLVGIERLLKSVYHEERLCALLLMVSRFSKGVAGERKDIYALYMNSTRYINSWDLVDSSAPHIVGAFLADKDKKPIHEFSVSDNLWERRIAVMSTFYFIRRNEYSDALKIFKRLIGDDEDLIHKAVGWMLREIGNRDPKVERNFLRAHYRKMPRTMLRYAIEKFPDRERRRYLEGDIVGVD